MQNVVVVVRRGDLTKALKRFKKKCEQELVLSDMRRTQHFVPPAAKRRLKSVRAVKRQQKVARSVEA
jgi:ribosomal protein S21